jgi:hypothetical protein
MNSKDIIGKRVELIEDCTWVGGEVKAGSRGTVAFHEYHMSNNDIMYKIIFDKKKPLKEYVFGFRMPFGGIRFLDEDE